MILLKFSFAGRNEKLRRVLLFTASGASYFSFIKGLGACKIRSIGMTSQDTIAS